MHQRTRNKNRRTLTIFNTIFRHNNREEMLQSGDLLTCYIILKRIGTFYPPTGIKINGGLRLKFPYIIPNLVDKWKKKEGRKKKKAGNKVQYKRWWDFKKIKRKDVSTQPRFSHNMKTEKVLSFFTKTNHKNQTTVT